MAVLAGLAVHVLMATYTVPANFLGRLFDSVLLGVGRRLGDAWGIGVTATVVFAVPALAAGLGVYGVLAWLAGRQEGDGEMRCRACGHILRGLSEPRCPECGEQI